MKDMPTRLAAADGANTGARINGVLDVPRPGCVSGWAIDRSDQDAAVTIRIVREGRLVGEVRADVYRPDLERGGVGTGRYGFVLDIDPPIEPGFEFTVTAVARTDDGTAEELRRIGRAARSDDPDRRLSERLFEEAIRLRHAIGRESRAPDASLEDAMARMEVVQARIEIALSTVEPPRRSGRGSLVVLVGLSFLIASASLALGLWSLLAA